MRTRIAIGFCLGCLVGVSGCGPNAEIETRPLVGHRGAAGPGGKPVMKPVADQEKQNQQQGNQPKK
jgi:hypothetical protein